MANLEPLTYAEYRERLEAIYPDKTIYTKLWSNYPRSIFHYDTPDFNGVTDNIGIYTAPTAYGFGSC